MKKITFTFLLAILNLFMYAQTSDSFSYQAIVRNSSGAEVLSQPVSFRFSIIKGGASGLSVYSEKHAKTTNQFGLVTLSVGNGTDKIGSLSSIDWGEDIYFLKVELDATGGTTYLDMGTTQLMSVPYALHAKTADNGFSGSYLDLTNKPAGNNIGDMQYWDGANWVVLPGGNNGQIITMNSSNIPTWQNASAVLLAPTSTTQPATNVQFFSATLNGASNANGLSSTVSFDWGLTTSYGNNILSSQSPITGNSNIAISASISGLQYGTTYHYRIKATNAVNASYSSDMSFTTPSTIPTLTTSAISTITSTTAISGGNITSDGGALITERGVCWTTTSNPTTANFKTIDGSGNGGFSSNLSGLTTGITYYVRAYATNTHGTVYGNQKSFIPIVIGDNCQGGIVAYFFQPNDPMTSPMDQGYIEGEQHGLIVAPSDQSTGTVWGCVGTWGGRDSVAIGTGSQNTSLIVVDCTTEGIAAKLCYDLVLGSYSDWYLPSRNDLRMLYLNRNVIGGFTTDNYWSSSAKDINNAWYVNFLNGTYSTINKGNSLRVRAVRSF